MALSVLSIHVSKGVYGLFDSISDSFLMTGTKNEMYKLKHEIEEAEQQEDNKKYFEGLIRYYTKLFSTIRNIEDVTKKSIERKIEVFQRCLNECT